MRFKCSYRKLTSTFSWIFIIFFIFDVSDKILSENLCILSEFYFFGHFLIFSDKKFVKFNQSYLMYQMNILGSLSDIFEKSLNICLLFWINFHCFNLLMAFRLVVVCFQ